MDRRLYALTEQGEEKWKYDLEGEVDRDGIVTSWPTLGSDGTELLRQLCLALLHSGQHERVLEHQQLA